MVKILSIALFVFCLHLTFGQDYSITKLNTPLKSSSYSPAYFGENLVICSHHKDRVYKTVYDKKGLEPADLYLINPNNLDSCERFDIKFRSLYNDGPITFNESSNLAVVSRNSNHTDKVNSNSEAINNLALYTSKIDTNNTWTDLELLSFIDTLYNYTHPSLSESGETLVFSSNKPGGFGGYDLWMSKFIDNSWEEPVNLGATINSDRDEVFPTINGFYLYFSSNINEKRGLDIYKVEMENLLAIPELLSEPLNSESDDFGLITKDNGNTGFLSSNRNGVDNIYKFSWLFPELPNCEPQVNDIFCYTLYEENSVELNDEQSLVYEWDINGVKVKGHPIDYCFPGEGDYAINLNIIDTIINQVFTNIATYNISLNYTEQPFIYSDDTLELNKLQTFHAGNSYLPKMSNVKFYWRIEDLIEGEGELLNYSFSDTGAFEVILGAIGTMNNEKHSVCVSKSIYVTDKILETNSAAELAENDNLSVSSIVRAYRTTNDSVTAYYSVEVFSTEKTIDTNYFVYNILSKQYPTRLEYNDELKKYSILVGEYEVIEQAYEVWFDLQAQGYYDAVIKTFLLENYNNIVFNEVFELSQIKFAANSSKIRPGASDDLNDIVIIMNKFPSLVLEVSAHTDSHGNDEFNLKLSEERGFSIQRELVNKGIDASRIIVKGYGESEPVATNETEEGRQKNRRVDFLLHQP